MRDIFSPEKRESRYCMGLIIYILGIIVSPIICSLVPNSFTDAGLFIAYITIIYLIYLVLGETIEYILFYRGKIKRQTT